MSDENSDGVREQLKALLDAAHKEPPLTAAERRQVRQLIANHERWTWLRKKVFVIAPWIITLAAGVGASWEQVLHLLMEAHK